MVRLPLGGLPIGEKAGSGLPMGRPAPGLDLDGTGGMGLSCQHTCIQCRCSPRASANETKTGKHNGSASYSEIAAVALPRRRALAAAGRGAEEAGSWRRLRGTAAEMKPDRHRRSQSQQLPWAAAGCQWNRATKEGCAG